MTSEQPTAPAPAAAGIGVATTTTVAFLHDGRLYLERMNVISEEGAGVRCEVQPAEGSLVPLVFRLSTAREVVRCQGRVLGPVATTPAGLMLRARLGDRAFKAAVGAAIGDSATAIFRMEDLEAVKKARAAKGAEAPAANLSLAGFCVRFEELDLAGARALSHHLAFSRRLSDQLAARGDRLVAMDEGDRAGIASLFDEGDLAARARDW